MWRRKLASLFKAKLSETTQATAGRLERLCRGAACCARSVHHLKHAFILGLCCLVLTAPAQAKNGESKGCSFAKGFAEKKQNPGPAQSWAQEGEKNSVQVCAQKAVFINDEKAEEAKKQEELIKTFASAPILDEQFSVHFWDQARAVEEIISNVALETIQTEAASLNTEIEISFVGEDAEIIEASDGAVEEPVINEKGEVTLRRSVQISFLGEEEGPTGSSLTETTTPAEKENKLITVKGHIQVFFREAEAEAVVGSTLDATNTSTGGGGGTSEPLVLNFSANVDFKNEDAQPLPELASLTVAGKTIAPGGSTDIAWSDLDKNKAALALSLKSGGAPVKNLTLTLGPESARLSEEGNYTGQILAEPAETKIQWSDFTIARKSYDSYEGTTRLNPDTLPEGFLALKGTFEIQGDVKELPLKVAGITQDGREFTLMESTVRLFPAKVSKVEYTQDGGRWMPSRSLNALETEFSPQDRHEYELQIRAVTETGDEFVYPSRGVKFAYSSKTFAQELKDRHKEMMAAFNSQDQSGFFQMTSEAFTSNIPSLGSRLDLENAIVGRFHCCVGKVTASIQDAWADNQGKKGQVVFQWSLKSDLSQAGKTEQWQFEKNEQGEWQLQTLQSPDTFLRYNDQVAEITLTSPKVSLPADALSVARIEGTAVDSAGQAVADGTILNVEAVGGLVPATVETLKGRFAFDFVAGSAPQNATVTVRKGREEATSSIQLLLVQDVPPVLPPDGFPDGF